MRSLKIIILFCLLLLVSVPVVVFFVIDMQLHKKSITWHEKSWDWNGIYYQDITHPSMTAQHLDISFAWPIHLHFRDVQLQKIPSYPSIQNNANSANSTTSPIPMRITVEQMQLPQNPLMEESMSGELYPNISIHSEALHMEEINGTTTITMQKQVEYDDFFSIKGDLYFELTNGNIKMEGLYLEHPLLETKLDLDFQGTFSQNKLQGDVTVGNMKFSCTVPFDIENKSFSGQFEGNIELSDIVQSLNIPEAKRIEVMGGIIVKGTIYGLPLHFSMTIEDIDFASTSGNLINPNELLFGTYPHKPLNSTEIRMTGPRSRDWVRLNDMGWLPKTVVAGEDSQFYEHKGYDKEQLQIAIREVLGNKENARGGSTITQQLAKNLFLSSERNFERKLKELLYTLELERRLEKDEILEIYLNIVEFGPNIYGIKEAANAYFVKTPQRLNLKEAAFLASILPAPQFFYNSYKQDRKPQTWRIDQVLQNLKDAEWISLSQLRQAQETQLYIVPLP